MILHQSSLSRYEYIFEDKDIIEDCFFYSPESKLDKIKRYISLYFPITRKPIDYEKYNKIIDYLKRKKVVGEVITSYVESHDFPSHFYIKIKLTNSLYGYSNDYTSHPSSALSKALGEALERFFLTTRPLPKMMDKINRRFLKKISLESFNDYLPEQKKKFPYLNRQPSEEYSYVPFERISNKESILIPAQLAFLEENSRPSVLLDQTTNGGGAHYNKTEAILSGLYELIQRDAFLLMWLLKESKDKIDIASIPQEEEILTVIEKVVSRGMEVHFINMKRDFNIHAVGCLVLDKRSGHANSGFGAASGTKIKKCLIDALSEALSILTINCNPESNFVLPDDYIPFLTEGIKRSERLTLWKNNMLEHLSFLTEGKKVNFNDLEKLDLHFNNTKEELSYMIDQVEKKGEGYEVYVHTAKSGLLTKLGYTVVKVTVPRLLSIYLSEHKATLKSERLAQAMGVTADEIKLDKLNPHPHPFP